MNKSGCCKIDQNEIAELQYLKNVYDSWLYPEVLVSLT